jgi:uncharacterized protein (TIGR01655 family)
MATGKKIVLIVVGIVLVACVVAVAVLGRQYYNDRYVGSDYYTMIPLDYAMTPEMKYDMDGKEMGLSMEYRLTAYNERGEAKEVEFSVMEEGSGWATAGPYPQPGTYLYIKASKQLVNGWDTIERGEIPAAVLDLIEAGGPSR